MALALVNLNILPTTTDLVLDAQDWLDRQELITPDFVMGMSKEQVMIKWMEATSVYLPLWKEIRKTPICELVNWTDAVVILSSIHGIRMLLLELALAD